MMISYDTCDILTLQAGKTIMKQTKMGNNKKKKKQQKKNLHCA